MLRVIYPDNQTFVMSGEVFAKIEPIDVFMNFVLLGIKWEINWNLCKEADHQEIFLADEIARSYVEEGAGHVRTLH
ncbi:MAG: hypothetical protein HYT94_04275 [Parcubacteria group bacterium]|nr:hypothetical protein [Parcubacteria group bacterium]